MYHEIIIKISFVLKIRIVPINGYMSSLIWTHVKEGTHNLWTHLVQLEWLEISTFTWCKNHFLDVFACFHCVTMNTTSIFSIMTLYRTKVVKKGKLFDHYFLYFNTLFRKFNIFRQISSVKWGIVSALTSSYMNEN